jgi:hypothetical protein
LYLGVVGAMGLVLLPCVPNRRAARGAADSTRRNLVQDRAPYAAGHPFLVIVAAAMMVVMMMVIVDGLITGRLISLRAGILPAHVVRLQQLCGIRYGFQ